MHPYAAWTLGLKTAQMLAEAQVVMTLRIWGMMGAWPVTPSETTRMWTEKGPAFVKAGNAAAIAAMKGHAPETVMSAALGPIGRKTRSNAKRLSRRRR